MSTQNPFVFLKGEKVNNAKGQMLLASERPWTSIMFKDSQGQLVLLGDALVDTGSSVTILSVSLADKYKILRPSESDEDAKTNLTGTTGQGFGWIGPAEIAFPALGSDNTYKIQCCFNPQGKYPILGSKEIFGLFQLQKGNHPVSGESGYFLVPLNAEESGNA
jgi:hypothetical protein